MCLPGRSCGSVFTVSPRNERHLTYLMRGDTPEGRDFLQRFGKLTILNPVSFLRIVDRVPS